jgi:hypothetical protein
MSIYQDNLNIIKEKFYEFYRTGGYPANTIQRSSNQRYNPNLIQRRIDPIIEEVIRLANEKYEEDDDFKYDLEEAVDELEKESNEKYTARFNGFPPPIHIEKHEKILQLVYDEAAWTGNPHIFSDIGLIDYPFSTCLPPENCIMYRNDRQHVYVKNVLELFRFILYNFDAKYEMCPLCLEEMSEPSSIIQCNRCKKWMHNEEKEGLCSGAQRTICWNRDQEKNRCPLCNAKWPRACMGLRETVDIVYDDSTLGGKKRKKRKTIRRLQRKKSRKSNRKSRKIK